jgi:hypothetical protein
MKTLRLVALVSSLLGTASAHAQTCETNANCTSPLVCKPASKVCSASAAILPDGGTISTEPVCENEPAVCTWSLVACTAKSQCTLPNWTCLQLPAEAASKVCFPEGTACAAGQACPSGWSCVDFSAVEESDLAEMWGSSDQTRYCFPDVLLGVTDHTTPVDSSGIEPGTSVGTIKGGDSSNSKSSSGCSLGGRSASLLPSCLIVGLIAARIWRQRR